MRKTSELIVENFQNCGDAGDDGCGAGSKDESRTSESRNLNESGVGSSLKSYCSGLTGGFRLTDLGVIHDENVICKIP